MTLCEEHGFRPQIVQEASHWLTILSLIGAGLGVSWDSPFGLINVDLGVPLHKELHDQTEFFRFDVGKRF